jgi:hypothetical protein
MIDIEAPSADPSIETVTDSGETQLADEIGTLWQVHAKAQTTATKSREELKAIRVDLARKLHDLKAVLSRPGRGGAWRSFLASQKIPRSSADRLVRGHERAINSDEKNCTGEHIPEPVEITIRRYIKGLWPRLSRVLTTRDSIEMFIAILRQTADKSFGVDQESRSQPVSSSPLAKAPYQPSLTVLHGLGPE